MWLLPEAARPETLACARLEPLGVATTGKAAEVIGAGVPGRSGALGAVKCSSLMVSLAPAPVVSDNIASTYLNN